MIRLVSLLWRIFGQSGDPFGLMFFLADYVAFRISKNEEKKLPLAFQQTVGGLKILSLSSR